MKKGTEVTINIPFTYTIGEDGFHSGKVLNSVEDCKAEVLAEIEAGVLSENEVFMTVEVKEEEEEVLYVLSEDAINSIKINERIPDEELFEYRIIDRKDFLDELIRWIGECDRSRANDKFLMTEDLKLLMDVEDEYILSSISTNAYLYQGCTKFNETCEELLKLNKKIKNKKR